MTGIVYITESHVTTAMILELLVKSNFEPFSHTDNWYVINNIKGDYIALCDDSESLKSDFEPQDLETVSKLFKDCRMYLFEYGDEVFLKEVLSLIRDNIHTKAFIEYGLYTIVTIDEYIQILDKKLEK